MLQDNIRVKVHPSISQQMVLVQTQVTDLRVVPFHSQTNCILKYYNKLNNKLNKHLYRFVLVLCALYLLIHT